LGVGGKESKKKAKTKGGGNQTANFRKPKIIMILEMMLGYINNASFNVFY